MVRKPKAKLCEDTGRWLANGASAKRGLNKALHSVNMGLIRQFTEYKLMVRGKLMVRVKPHYSSQECSHMWPHRVRQPTVASDVLVPELWVCCKRG